MPHDTVTTTSSSPFAASLGGRRYTQKGKGEAREKTVAVLDWDAVASRRLRGSVAPVLNVIVHASQTHGNSRHRSAPGERIGQDL